MTSDARRLRVGVLGCGQIAQAAHFEACRRARNAELYAICDVAEDLLRRMAIVHEPAMAYRDYDQMLADPRVDAVVVAIADQFHVAAARRAIEAGKHVLVEKPLGVSVEEVEGLRSLVHDAGVVLQVGTMKRFDPGIAFARRFVEEEMGELLALKVWYCDSTHRYTMTGNLQPLIVTSTQARRPEGDPKADRRRYYLLGHGSHLVDLARFLGGEIASVRATLVEKFGAYCWFVEVGYASGAVGHLDLTIAVRMDWHEGFQIYGEHGSVLGRTYNPWYLKGSDVECFSERDGQYRRILGADAHFYRLQVEGLAETILDGVPMHGADVDDGVAAVRALAAIARSSETGERVRLADVEGPV
ncbi:MAG TPA: Gfo/Idh/MocA family oxidoreductase [Thermomicrobiales bacterium]|jgi:predicted dehydrogenase